MSVKFGLIAGNGEFPFLVVEGARKAGASLAVVAIKEETDKRIEEIAEKVIWVGIGQLGKMISYVRQEEMPSISLYSGVAQNRGVRLFT